MSSALPVATADLVCIGMRFVDESRHSSRRWSGMKKRWHGDPHSARSRDADIEHTILGILGAFPDDTRLASVFLSWIKVHGNRVIVEKLVKFAAKRTDDTGAANSWLSLTAAWAAECGYHKWKKLIKKVPAPAYLYQPAVSESAIRLKGAVPWLEPLGFRIPQGSFRIREDDVLSPEMLVRRNLQYRNRCLFGASWRADIITAIQRGITSPAEICRAVGCSYEPAYRVSHEYSMACT